MVQFTDEMVSNKYLIKAAGDTLQIDVIFVL